MLLHAVHNTQTFKYALILRARGNCFHLSCMEVQSVILKAFNIEIHTENNIFKEYNLKCSRYRWSVYGLKTRSGSETGNREGPKCRQSRWTGSFQWLIIYLLSYFLVFVWLALIVHVVKKIYLFILKSWNMLLGFSVPNLS